MALLGDTKAVSLTLLDGVIGDLNPKTTEVYNLGTNTLKWNNMYANFYHTLTTGANTSGNSGFAIEDTTGQTYGNLYLVTRGTTGVEGTAGLALGNNIATGTAKNAKGCLYLYGSQSKYTTFKTTVTDNTNNNTFILPDYAGTSYLTHVSGTSKVGDTNLSVYVAANGRVTATGYTFTTDVPASSSNDTTIPTSKAVWSAVNALTDTKNTAGSTDTSSKIYLIGATELAANPLTYSDDEVFVTNGVLDAKAVSTSKLYIYGSSTSDKTNRFLYSDAATNIYASINSVIPLVMTNAEVRRGASATSINLGSSSYPWNNIYGKIGYIGNITISGASTDDVARYRLLSSSTLYLESTAGSIIFRRSGTELGRFNNAANTTSAPSNFIPNLNNYLQLGDSTHQWVGTYITKLNATNLTSGTVAFARLPSLYAGKITINSTNANDIYAGTVAVSSSAIYNTTPEVASVKYGNGTIAAATKGFTVQFNETDESLDFIYID